MKLEELRERYREKPDPPAETASAKVWRRNEAGDRPPHHFNFGSVRAELAPHFLGVDPAVGESTTVELPPGMFSEDWPDPLLHWEYLLPGDVLLVEYRGDDVVPMESVIENGGAVDRVRGRVITNNSVRINLQTDGGPAVEIVKGRDILRTIVRPAPTPSFRTELMGVFDDEEA